MEKFIPRFQQMLDELMANPEYVVVSYYIFPPATEAEITAAEEFLGFPLPEDVKSFYQECNGVQLMWVSKKNESYNARLYPGTENAPFTYQEVLEESSSMDGIVNILPINRVFITDSVLQMPKPDFRYDPITLIIDNISFNCSEIDSKVFIFDPASRMYDAAFYPHKDSLIVLEGSNEHSCFHRSKPISFELYLDSIIKLKGSHKFRYRFFWQRKPMTTFNILSNEDYNNAIQPEIDAFYSQISSDH